MQIAPPDLLSVRVARLRAALAAGELDALVVTSLPNIAYLSGLFASAGALVVAPDTLQVIGDGRYRMALADRARAFAALTPIIFGVGSSYDEAIVAALGPLAGLRTGFEAEHLSVHRHRSITSRLAHYPGWQEGLVETNGIVETLRLT